MDRAERSFFLALDSLLIADAKRFPLAPSRLATTTRDESYRHVIVSYHHCSPRNDASFFHSRPHYQIDKRSMSGHHGGHRVMVRTCNGLELRDPSLFVETSASELIESSVLFPSVDSRDELQPR